MHNYFWYYADMNKTFKTRSLTDTLTLLCFAKGGDFLRGGKVNQSEVARKAGTTQTNVSRWYAGEHTPTDESVKLLAKAFNITPSQMRGEVPIEELDGITDDTPLQREIIYLLGQLPEEYQRQVREQVLFYSTVARKDDGRQ